MFTRLPESVEDLRSGPFYSDNMSMLTVEIDPKTEQILTRLTASGRSTTDVVREAIRLAGQLQWMEQARADASRLADDPDDLAEIEAIRGEFGDANAW